MEYLAVLNAFCVQLSEFCVLFQREMLANGPALAGKASIASALSFSEKLILCPTAEAAQICIRRDLAGARSFLIAAEGVLKRIRRQRFEFARECPRCQTRFYLLSVAVEEFLNTSLQNPPVQKAPFYAPKAPVLPP